MNNAEKLNFELKKAEELLPLCNELFKFSNTAYS